METRRGQRILSWTKWHMRLPCGISNFGGKGSLFTCRSHASTSTHCYKNGSVGRLWIIIKLSLYRSGLGMCTYQIGHVGCCPGISRTSKISKQVRAHFKAEVILFLRHWLAGIDSVENYWRNLRQPGNLGGFWLMVEFS